MTMQLHELFGLGVAILVGLFGGKVARRLKVPRVTGYLLVGLLIGPYVLGLISENVVGELNVINDIALGLILFAIGNEFEFTHLKNVGIRELLKLALFETAGVFVLITLGFLLLGFDPVFSMLAGTVGIATAPAATLLVIREYNTRGPLTDRLLALVAVNNVISLVLFRVILSMMTYETSGHLLTGILTPLYEVVVSLALGYLIGKGLMIWEDHLDELPELLLVIIGAVLLGTGMAHMLKLSPMLVAMGAGATVANSSRLHRLIYVEQRQLEQPVYIAFFVLAGTSLHLDVLPQMGIAGLVYLVARTAGKVGGIYAAGLTIPERPQIGKYLGMTMLCQAGVAIGEAYEVLHRFPEKGQLLTTIVLATVIVNETLGPYLVRLGLSFAREMPTAAEHSEIEELMETVAEGGGE